MSRSPSARPSPGRRGPGQRGRAHQPSFAVSVDQLGLIVFMISLGVLFAATLVAYLVTRAQAPRWQPDGARALPLGLLASTLLLVGVSAACRAAVGQIRRNRPQGLETALLVAGGFALAFLVVQSFNARVTVAAHATLQPPTLYAFTLLMLLALHAAHVLGGLGALAWVLQRARAGEYSSSRHEPVRLCAQYWHFIDAVWLVLLGTLYVAT